MKVSFLKNVTAVIIALSFAADARSQDGSSLKIGGYTGKSIPLGEYREGISRARNGYSYGFFSDYTFDSGLGIGVDIRYGRNPHQSPDTVYNNSMFATSNTANTYSSPQRFSNLGILLGPSYQIGGGRLNIDLYARAGLLIERFPTYVQREKKITSYPGPYTTPIEQTTELSRADVDRKNGWAALFGVRLDLEIFPSVGLFLYGDYQAPIGTDAGFTAKDLQSGQTSQPIGAKVAGFGGGIRVLFGAGYGSGMLRQN
ncbi:outer membrane beta-barrel protein [Fluviicola sp.]|uniref:outer membrane beta-barrel protein n=1 Tax=Fluviicola sp. TaxID=1917219 RepID=UPI0031D9B7CF